jgi:tRNA-uridine 2-sulfurtransferase
MRVVAAMSGGVDSSVTAGLLLEQGHEVIGVHMKLHDAPPPGVDSGTGKTCCGLDDVLDCSRVADRLGIPFYVMDLRKEFQKAVMDNFSDNYLRGLTPNPCIQCNGVLKFRILLRRAEALGASHLATGHYARISDRKCLMQAVDANKDQSYFLFPITSEALEKTLFPLGGLTKDEVRGHAERMGLVTAKKPESQDICFIPDGDHSQFIGGQRQEAEGAGNIVLEDGTVVGRHDGYWRYTIGQRKGLRVALGEAKYVIRIDPDSRDVVIGPPERLLQSSLEAVRINWFRKPKSGEALHARIRHRGALHPCTIDGDDPLLVHFQSPARAISPGQAVVIYAGKEVIAGGWIQRSIL